MELKNKFSIFLMLFYFILVSSCEFNTRNIEILSLKQENNILQLSKSYFEPLPYFDIDQLPPNEKQIMLLGKKLFFDKILSKNNAISCSTCHIMEQFGVDNKVVSNGVDNKIGKRNTPTVLNAFLQYKQFWDAHASTVEEQCVGPLFGDFEMNLKDTLELISKLSNNIYYKGEFLNLFPDEKLNSINIESIKRVIGAFERTLITPSPFDKYLDGDLTSISTKAKLGIKSFIDNGCVPCHSSNLIGGQMAQKFSLYGYYWDFTGNEKHIDRGIYDVTLNPADKFYFKVPTLRNVEKTYPYFHDGSVHSLSDAVIIMGKAELNIELEDEDVANIIAFLKTLTGTIPPHAFNNEDSLN